MSDHPKEAGVSGKRPTIAHLPALDGLRGAAVIGVLLFHDDRLRGGYLGVDLFFVLSGFLITSLLIAEHRGSGRIDLKAFWVRRARRLFPAVLVVLPAVALYARLFAKPSERPGIFGDGLATLAYFANWRTIFAGKSYWDLFNAPSPLEHTWSLAIEEQFYVLWPLLVVLVIAFCRKTPQRSLFFVSLGLALLSALAMALLFDADSTSRAYLGTDTRGAAILAGAALACVMSGQNPFRGRERALDVAGALALIGLAAAWALLDGKSSFLYRGGFWLTEIAVIVLIACAAQTEKSVVAKALSMAPLRWVGLVSYGVYLWHWPIYCALTRPRVGVGGFWLSVLRIAATFAVALLSYRFLEQPIRKRGIWFGRPVVVVPISIAAVIGLLVLGTRVPAEASPPVAAAGPALHPSFGNYNDHIRELPPPGSVPKDTLRVLVVGDSVAVALGDRLRYMQDSGNTKVAVRANGDCNILDQQYPTKSLNNRRHDGGDCDAEWEKDTKELAPDVTLIILGGGFFAPVEIGGAWRVACDKEWHDAIYKELGRNVKTLTALSKKVVLARVPYPVEHWAKEQWDRATDCWNALIDKVAADSPGVVVLDLKEKLCPGKDHTACILESKGAEIRPDGMHFEGLGGEEIARWTLAQLR